MRLEIGFQPNCSDVVLHISSMNKEKLLPILAEIGIVETCSPKDEEDLVLIDKNSISLVPGGNGRLRITDDYIGCVDYKGGCCVVGSQHCSEDIFPTMKHIQDHLENKGLLKTEWQGDDGGNTVDYEDWIEDGAQETNNKRLPIDARFQFSKSDAEPIIKYMREVYGIKLRFKVNPDGAFLKGMYNPDTTPSCLLPPSRFGGMHQGVWFEQIKDDLYGKILELGDEYKESG